MQSWSSLPGVTATGLVVVEDVEMGQGWTQNRSGAERLPLAIPLGLTDRLCGFRFCLAFPLTNAEGGKQGTLFMYKKAPHVLDHLQEAIVFDMVHLVGSYLERSLLTWRCATKAVRSSLDMKEEALLLLDAASHPWKITHMNPSASRLTGVEWRSEPVALSSVFDPKSLEALGRRERKSILEETFGLRLIGDAQRRIAFSLRTKGGMHEEAMEAQSIYLARLQAGPTASSSEGGTSGSATSEPDLWNGPNQVPAQDMESSPSDTSGGTEDAGVDAGVAAMTSRQRADRSWAVAAGRAPMTGPFEGLELGKQLGRGASGRVYLGTYFGETVAVKVIDNISAVHLQGGVPLEALLPSRLQHPNMVKTLGQRLTSEEGGEVSPDAQHVSAWYIMEFCDLEDLGAAVVHGRFQTPEGGQFGRCNMPLVVDIALDVAHAMAYMHGKGIIHGDLSGGNVLLTRNSASPHNCTARIGDFGLSRQLLDVRSRVSTNSYGTVNYLAPEVVSDGSLSKAGDVYAFGVLCWEMVNHERAWARMLHAQIMYAVLISGKKLQFADNAHPDFAALATRCMSTDRKERPRFAECVHILTGIKDALRGDHFE